MNKKTSLSIQKFKHILYSCYDSTTGYKSTEKIWTKENKYLGQCTVTALLVHDYFGGYIKRGYIKERNMYHYWNSIEGEKIDFTIEQIGNSSDVNVEKIITKSKNSLLKIKSVSDRYLVLKKLVKKRIKEWSDLEKSISLCRNCDMETYFEHDSVHFGNKCELLFVGEAPAKDGWRVTGKAWHNPKGKLVPSGKNFSKLLKIVDLNIEDATFVEAVKCYPPGGKVLGKHLINCFPFLAKQINLLDPLVIIPMGVKPTKVLLNQKEEFSTIVGNFSTVQIGNKEYTVFPIYHPSPISPKSLKNNTLIFKNFRKFLLKIERDKKNIKF